MKPRSSPPRILLLNQFYWPDGAPTAALLDDVARELVRRGCEVTAICGHAAYLAQSQEAPPPVRILHMPAYPYSRSPVVRMLSWLTYLFSALVRAVFSRKYDLVLALTSPPGIALVGVALKLLRGSQLWIWEMDIYPDVATALDVVKPGSFLAGVSQKLFTAIRRQADGIIALGECARKLLLKQDLAPERIAVAENWARSELIQPLPLPPAQPLHILYSGNLGMAHDTGTIAEVMLRLRDREDIRFTIAGGGKRRLELENFCREHGLRNVEFRGYVDWNILSQSLGSCHIGLVTLRPVCLGTVVPSKVYYFLAAARPFLYIGPLTATPAHIAGQGCGWAFETGAVDGVVAQLLALRDNPALLQEASSRSRALFEQQYDLQHGTARIANLLLNSLDHAPHH